MEASLKTALINSDWMRYWQGVPMSGNGTGTCIAGYSTVDKRMKFFEGFVFEEVVEYGQIGLWISTVNSQGEVSEPICPPRDEGEEFSLYKGRWELKNDTIVLYYLEELIYDRGNLGNYLYDFKPGDPTLIHTGDQPLRRCEIEYYKEFKLWEYQ